MFTHLKRIFLSILLCITTSIVHAEYIVFKDGHDADGTAVMLPLDEREHAQAYAVLMKYQFPMSLCHDLEKELSKDELAALDKDEEAFIQGKMPAGIKVAFIPTTLYELYAVQSYEETVKTARDSYELEKAYPVCDDKLKLVNDAPKSNTTSDLKKYLKAMHQRNAYAKKAHFFMNSYCIAKIKSSEYLQSPLTWLVMFLKEAPISHPFLTKPQLIDLLFSSSRLQIQAHKNNQWLLFRAGSQKDSTVNRSLSFGSSIFAGYFRDMGGCVFHVTTSDSACYAITIDKKHYRTNPAVNNLWFIPPITTLIGLASMAETFHPRTKIFQTKNLYGFHAGLADPAYLLTNKKVFESAAALEQAYQDYASKNLVWLMQPEQTPIRAKL